MIDVSADARGAAGELDDEDAVDDNCYFSADAAEDDNFERVPVPVESEEALRSGEHIRVLFTTGWERGRVQERNEMTAKQT